MAKSRLNFSALKNFLSLNDIFHNRTTSPETMETARRRLLNEPFYMMALNLCIWIFAAFFFAYLIKIFGEPRPVVFRIFLISLNTGLVTAVMCFFLLEHVSQKHISRFFFPEGGLYNTSKTIRIRIFIRFLALLFACNIIPLFISGKRGTTKSTSSGKSTNRRVGHRGN
ncbi:MAG: hypothetical protein GY850_09525 [bacterium]|nr:hypothetical protein [bacterium]